MMMRQNCLAVWWILALLVGHLVGTCGAQINNLTDATFGEDWTCRDNTLANNVTAFVCENDLVGVSHFGFDPPLPEGLVQRFQCNVPTLNGTGPNREDCEQACDIYSPERDGSCSECQLMRSGMVIYSCENLYPTDQCPLENQNELGACNSFVDEWWCRENDPNVPGTPTPYFCYNQNSAQPAVASSVPSHFGMLFDCNVPELVSGDPTLDECVPKCFIFDILALPDFRFCSSCTLLENGDIAYDCSNLYPDAECSQTDVRGECLGDGSQGGELPFYYNCLEMDGLSTPYACFTEGSAHPSLDSSFPPLTTILYCDAADWTEPSLDVCISSCYIFDPNQEGARCNSCTLLDSGDIAYDCGNLFPNAECPEKDIYGECSDHFNWLCEPQGNGFYCYPYFFEVASNPAFLYDEDVEARVDLFCANDITGRHESECEESICSIRLSNSVDTSICNSCELQHTGSFSYDCSNLPINMTCYELLPNATCVSERSFTADECYGCASFNSTFAYSYSAGEQVEGKEDDGWILKSVHPTTFNVASDLFAVFTTMVIGFAIASLSPVLTTWKLKRGPVPLEEVGAVPGNFFSAMAYLKTFSLPALLLAVLLLVTDYSHAVADTGLDFVSVKAEGPHQPVLVIGDARRNSHLPLEIYGDPRTTILPQSSYQNILKRLTDEELAINSREELALTTGYFAAVAELARGQSPFSTGTSEEVSRIGVSYGGVSGFSSFFVTGNVPLVKMRNELPLDCSSANLTGVDQEARGASIYEKKTEASALIPNCTWTSLRESGIYNPNSGSAEILERAYSTTFGESDDVDIFFTNGSSSFRLFPVPSRSRRLTRDREDLRKGRVFYEVDGLTIGNVDVEFGNVVVASGSQDEIWGDDEIGRYTLVAEVSGDCPPRPSGASAGDTECIVFSSLLCDIFPEDREPFHSIYNPHDAPVNCELRRVSIVWGRNFVVDSELVAVVGGLAGVVTPNFEDRTEAPFLDHSLLAALLALGTLETRSSTEDLVRPKISPVYVSFMLLPLVVSILIYLFTLPLQKKCLPFPKTKHDFMVLAQECDSGMIPKRQNCRGAFPLPESDLVLKFFDASQDEEDFGPDVFIALEPKVDTVSKRPITMPPRSLEESMSAVKETPVSDDEEPSYYTEHAASAAPKEDAPSEDPIPAKDAATDASSDARMVVAPSDDS